MSMPMEKRSHEVVAEMVIVVIRKEKALTYCFGISSDGFIEVLCLQMLVAFRLEICSCCHGSQCRISRGRVINVDRGCLEREM